MPLGCFVAFSQFLALLRWKSPFPFSSANKWRGACKWTSLSWQDSSGNRVSGCLIELPVARNVWKFETDVHIISPSFTCLVAAPVTPGPDPFVVDMLVNPPCGSQPLWTDFSFLRMTACTVIEENSLNKNNLSRFHTVRLFASSLSPVAASGCSCFSGRIWNKHGPSGDRCWRSPSWIQKKCAPRSCSLATDCMSQTSTNFSECFLRAPVFFYFQPQSTFFFFSIRSNWD